jgi:hypothetical protein
VSRCRIELRRRNGEVIATEVVSGPPSPWGGRPLEEELHSFVHVAKPRAVASATVECVPRGQRFGS